MFLNPFLRKKVRFFSKPFFPSIWFLTIVFFINVNFSLCFSLSSLHSNFKLLLFLFLLNYCPVLPSLIYPRVCLFFCLYLVTQTSSNQKLFFDKKYAKVRENEKQLFQKRKKQTQRQSKGSRKERKWENSEEEKGEKKWINIEIAFMLKI